MLNAARLVVGHAACRRYYLFKLRWRRFDFVLVSVPSGLITAITVVLAIGSGRQAMALALEYVTLLARFL